VCRQMVVANPALRSHFVATEMIADRFIDQPSRLSIPRVFGLFENVVIGIVAAVRFPYDLVRRPYNLEPVLGGCDFDYPAAPWRLLDGPIDRLTFLPDCV
jgi:hypothetical protein